MAKCKNEGCPRQAAAGKPRCEYHQEKNWAEIKKNTYSFFAGAFAGIIGNKLLDKLADKISKKDTSA